MARLPNPGGDANTWGDILNNYLSAEHNADGSQKPLAQSKVTSLISDLAAKEDKSAKGSAGGYAGLDSNSKIPTANIPDQSLPVEDFTQGIDPGFGFGASWEAFDSGFPNEHPATTRPPNTKFKYQGGKIWIVPGGTQPMALVTNVFNSPIYTISDAEAAELQQFYGQQFYPNVAAFAFLYDNAYNSRSAYAIPMVYFANFGNGGNNGIWFGGWAGPFVNNSLQVVVPNPGDRVLIGNSFMIDINYPPAT